jgi:hypothetical protein
MASPKPLTPEAVHARILKRGIGNWVAVQVLSGAAFGGRIVRIDEKSFGLQLHNDPTITPVLYSDVVDLRTGISRGGFWAIGVAGIAGVVVMALVAHHELDQASKLPGEPAGVVVH